MTNPATKPDLSPVTVIGLGAMGTVLAEALLAAGHPTTVWNRSAGKADRLVAAGGVAATTAAEAVAASPLVIVCLLDAASVREVLAPASHALAGRVVVNLTTGSPQEGRQLAEWAAKQGTAGFLDGGIMAIPSLIGTSHGFVLYSGSERAFRQHEPTLRSLARAQFVGGDPGMAALLDLALLAGAYGMFAGFLQAVALAGTGEVAATEFTDSLLVPWLQAMTGALPELARQVDVGDYTSAESSLAMQTAGISLVEFSESVGLSGDLLAPMEAFMKQRVADGGGDDDLSGVIELIRRQAAPGGATNRR